MSSTNISLPEDVIIACGYAQQVTKEKLFGNINMLISQMFFTIQKTDFGGFEYGAKILEKFSDIAELFPEKYKSITPDIISTIRGVSYPHVNWYYLDNGNAANVFQIPILEKSSNDDKINITIMRFVIVPTGCWTKKWVSPYVHADRKMNYTIADMENIKLSDAQPCKICNTTEKETKKCGNCEMVSYCSRKCQKKDWKKHKAVCLYKSKKTRKS